VRKIALAALVLLILLAVAAVVAVRSRFADERIRTTLEAQASAAIGEPVRIGTIDVSWFPRPGLTLGRVVVGASNALTIERLVLSTGLRPLLSGHIAEADVAVEHSRLDAPRFFAVLTGPSTSARAADHPASPLPLTIDAIRSIALRDVALTSGQRTVVVDADLAYTAAGLAIQRLTARSDITDLRASGAITDLTRRVGSLTIDAASLDLDGLIEFMAPFGSGTEPQSNRRSASAPFDITTTVKAKEGRAVGAAFTNLSTTSRVTNGRVTLDGLRFSLFGGQVDGNVVVRTDAAEPQYEWRGTVTNVNVARLMEFAGATNAITGTLDARATLRGGGASVHSAFTTASGTSHVTVRDGRVPGLEVVRTVILAFGRPSTERPAGSGEQFKQLSADLSVSGGRAKTQNLTFVSRDFDMRGEGWVDLRTQAIDLTVDVVLSRELSAQAGRDLIRYASEGDRVVLPGRITGTAAHPGISIDTAQALQRALKNELKSRARSLLERIIR
jgi:uncharacterized protein YhdP